MAKRSATQRASWRGRGPLRPAELAEAAVLADVSVALIVIGWLLPGTTLFIAAAIAPMAAIAARNRPRAVLAGGIAGTTVGMLIAGTGLASNVAACAVIGTVLGVAWRRRWRLPRVLLVASGLLWPVVAIGTDTALVVFGQLRILALDQITNTWGGVKADLREIGLVRLTDLIDPVVRWMVTHWAIGVPAFALVAILVFTLAGHLLTWPALQRLERTRLAAPSIPVIDGHEAQPQGPGPVPVQLVDVGHTYPGVTVPALCAVSLTIEPGQFVAVVGPNGSGKSTLAGILGGRTPTSGTVIRPGAVAAGRPGGTAMIFQRPESQVLGIRVRDDLVWGLPRRQPVDVEALLARVGLDGFAERETSTLSGGELQRVAVAAALARQPRLLISDEATAMVDAEGRALLTDLLAGLAADEGLAVVHVTHRLEEATRADRTLYLDHGHLVPAPAQPTPAPPLPASLLPAQPPLAPARTVPAAAPRTASHQPVPAAAPTTAPPPSARRAVSGPTIQLAGVGHVYTARSPWAHRALTGVDLTIDPGEAVMILGHNGSGKSTLAWILAGLLVPSEGEAMLDGRPLDERLGRVALSFQHARLQLLHSTVRRDVRAAGGVDDAGADAAMALVGLDPVELGSRAVDQLSGGQQRRVALAGMLARGPGVVVLDEPFAGLDDDARRGLIAVLQRLRNDIGVTLIVVSHDTEGAEPLVDRVVTLANGRVVADGPARPLTAPTSGGRQ